ncbi:putative short-chain dehydrogenase reductase 2a-like [Capsicum annuum]|nr:dnaJ homolog subfamily C member 28 [Capsicum annuum]KAF3646076.1 putative short-chain dehydrogenase reductase 2a-like [Capsicum annuum]
MAARFARLIGALSSSATHKSAAGIETVSHGVFKPRWSSSSFTEGQFPKTNKKMNDRLSGVIDVVNDRKLPPELRGQRDAVRSETDIINVVEQRIWHSMEEGQFENLPGKGKPLDLNTNPHADPAEDTLYRILSKNKCAPEWVELNKEIRTKVAEWRSALKKAWMHRGSVDDSKWIEASGSLKLQIHDINNKVFRYNLIVPFGRQILGLKWEKEMDRLKEESTGS